MVRKFAQLDIDIDKHSMFRKDTHEEKKMVRGGVVHYKGLYLF